MVKPVSLKRSILRTLGGIVLAFGILGGVSRVMQRQNPPQVTVTPRCGADICELDFSANINLRAQPPQLGLERECGAKKINSLLLNDNLIRYRVDVSKISPENPCDVHFFVGGVIFDYSDALSR